MEIRITLTEDDLLTGVMHLNQRSPALRRHQRFANMATVASAVLVTIVLGWVLDPDGIWVYVGMAAVLAAVLYPVANWYDRRTQRRVTRRMLREGSARLAVGDHTLRAAPDGLHCHSDHSSSRIAWAAIEQIEEDGDYTFIHLGGSTAVVLPRARLDPARHDEFVAAVRQALTEQGQAGPDPAAAPTG